MNKLNLNSTLLKASALSAAALPATGMAAEKSKPQSDRPNIVVIVADDLLSSELSCYGGKNIPTSTDWPTKGCGSPTTTPRSP